MQYNVKIKHKRFLSESQAEELKKFGFKVILNNHVYKEYSAHVPMVMDIDENTINIIKATFEGTVIEENLITINIVGEK